MKRGLKIFLITRYVRLIHILSLVGGALLVVLFYNMLVISDPLYCNKKGMVLENKEVIHAFLSESDLWSLSTDGIYTHFALNANDVELIKETCCIVLSTIEESKNSMDHKYNKYFPKQNSYLIWYNFTIPNTSGRKLNGRVWVNSCGVTRAPANM